MSPKGYGKIPRWLVVVFAGAALAGFIDASYLTAEHIRGAIPPCSVVSGCQLVLTSPYATVAGMPVAALGMLHYGTLLVLLIAFVDTKKRVILHVACWQAAAGFIATLYFLYIQAFVIQSFCLYCLGSALVSLILLVAAARIMRID